VQLAFLADVCRFVGSFYNEAERFCGLAKVAIFTTNVDAENQILTNHKCVCGALDRQFFVGAVMCGSSFTRPSLRYFLVWFYTSLSLLLSKERQFPSCQP